MKICRVGEVLCGGSSKDTVCFELGHCWTVTFIPDVPNVTDEGSACLLHVRKVPISNLSPYTGCSE